MAKTTANKTMINPYLPNELYDIIRTEFETTGMPISRIVERLLRKGIAAEKLKEEK
jgi:hypothetical protein